MPGFIVHTLLGDRILGPGPDGPPATDLPFPVNDAGLRAAFLTGCVGPDMGMHPGGDVLFSDLAHYVRSGELARALVREARTDADRAFAWGWAAHVLADALIHPLVNVAAGDARGVGPLTYADDPWLHIAVEFGADGDYFAHWRERGLTRLPPPPPTTADHLGLAYHVVYGPAVGAGAVRRSLAAWARWHPFAVAAAGAAAENLYGRRGGRHGLYGACRRAVRSYTGAFARRSPLHAVTHPLKPSVRAAGLIETAVQEFPEHFRELLRGGLDSLPDYNLDTGIIEQLASYPPAVATLARLEKTVGKVSG